VSIFCVYLFFCLYTIEGEIGALLFIIVQGEVRIWRTVHRNSIDATTTATATTTDATTNGASTNDAENR
jgi:hypothetical protein